MARTNKSGTEQHSERRFLFRKRRSSFFPQMKRIVDDFTWNMDYGKHLFSKFQHHQDTLYFIFRSNKEN